MKMRILRQSFYPLSTVSDIEQGFLPWLMDCVTDQLKKSELGRMVLDGLLRDVVEKRRALYDRLEAPKDNDPPKETAKPPSAKTPTITLEVTPQQAPATTIEVGVKK